MHADETLDSTRGPEVRAQRPNVSSRLLSALMAWLRDSRRRRCDQRLLMTMSERELDDIGLTWADGSSLSRRPPYDRR